MFLIRVLAAKMRNWFSFIPNVIRYEDSFARSLQGKWQGIRSALQEITSDRAHVAVLVTHFADAFTQLQDTLEESQINYEVLTGKLNRQWFASLPDAECRVWLTLAEMLEPFPPQAKDQLAADQPVRISVLVAEKHPLASRDEHVQEFCQTLPCKVKWGYFLSFEDALVGKLVDERALKILDMFGMGQYEMISSKMVSNRLNVALKKMQSNYHSQQPADSAAQWLENNLGDDSQK